MKTMDAIATQSPRSENGNGCVRNSSLNIGVYIKASCKKAPTATAMIKNGFVNMPCVNKDSVSDLTAKLWNSCAKTRTVNTMVCQ